MTDRFDPNIPFTGNPLDPWIQGEFTGVVAVTENPTLGRSNLVVNPAAPFEISVDWHVFGNIASLWLNALKAGSPNWVVTAYAESMGPGDEKILVSELEPVGAALGNDVAYSHTLTVPAGTLPEENPGDPTQSGVYKLVVTVFLDSVLGPVGYDVMGYAEGPIIKVENPV